ncbi:DUF31 family putative serine protease [Candidatus Mycoplasma pogonae]
MLWFKRLKSILLKTSVVAVATLPVVVVACGNNIFDSKNPNKKPQQNPGIFSEDNILDNPNNEENKSPIPIPEPTPPTNNQPNTPAPAPQPPVANSPKVEKNPEDDLEESFSANREFIKTFVETNESGFSPLAVKYEFEKKQKSNDNEFLNNVLTSSIPNKKLNWNDIEKVEYKNFDDELGVGYITFRIKGIDWGLKLSPSDGLWKSQDYYNNIKDLTFSLSLINESVSIRVTRRNGNYDFSDITSSSNGILYKNRPFVASRSIGTAWILDRLIDENDDKNDYLTYLVGTNVHVGTMASGFVLSEDGKSYLLDPYRISFEWNKNNSQIHEGFRQTYAGAFENYHKINNLQFGENSFISGGNNLPGDGDFFNINPIGPMRNPFFPGFFNSIRLPRLLPFLSATKKNDLYRNTSEKINVANNFPAFNHQSRNVWRKRFNSLKTWYRSNQALEKQKQNLLNNIFFIPKHETKVKLANGSEVNYTNLGSDFMVLKMQLKKRDLAVSWPKLLRAFRDKTEDKLFMKMNSSGPINENYNLYTGGYPAFNDEEVEPNSYEQFIYQAERYNSRSYPSGAFWRGLTLFKSSIPNTLGHEDALKQNPIDNYSSFEYSTEPSGIPNLPEIKSNEVLYYIQNYQESAFNSMWSNKINISQEWPGNEWSEAELKNLIANQIRSLDPNTMYSKLYTTGKRNFYEASKFIKGGSSGSMVINPKREIVGIVASVAPDLVKRNIKNAIFYDFYGTYEQSQGDKIFANNISQKLKDENIYSVMLNPISS